MSALMADHRDFADEERQASLFDVLAQPSARPSGEEPEGGRVVEFPRRREVPASAEPGADASALTPSPATEALGERALVPAAAPSPAETLAPPTGLLEPAPTVAPEDEWLTEIAPDVDEAERSMLAPDVPGAPRTQRAAGAPLAGPTLDDVVSRVWEGLVMALPAACPVCDGEVLPAPPGVNGGSCTSCGTTID
ncbi:hypothetical protein DVA67_027760 [Solirubrobacter sp. CPCC 204708]|uniref:Uncharacterized protein n=1 Tax=Solirubrobacter deserti TaxID=2282478 RepID=A0ABT4RJM4_9ACTN|nr:hypothetical protein [Solirubrobacter deserti]MBE2319793.1 hypothetical protein [Solirubrobacter deserti]MDA0138723.1 hypothetical protein [Solirubrobacter deserti]